MSVAVSLYRVLRWVDAAGVVSSGAAVAGDNRGTKGSDCDYGVVISGLSGGRDGSGRF
ncbi:hypothetical protein D9M68_712980 [compost metagenome]